MDGHEHARVITRASQSARVAPNTISGAEIQISAPLAS
jgi:hypothetical protein